jgi:hypothetical protein
VTEPREKKCWYCRRRKPAPGKSTCLVCLGKQRNQQRARRANAKKKGLCVRCQKRKPKSGRLTCAVCIASSGENKVVLQENRRLDGLCPLCGRKPEKGRVHCKRCLKQLAKTQRGRVRRGTSDRTRNERVARWRRKQRVFGRCIVCARKVQINPKTNKFYSMCPRHLQITADAKRQRRNLTRRRFKRR